MEKNTETLSEKALAFVLVEAEPGPGKIVLPGADPFLLKNFPPNQRISFDKHIVIEAGKSVRIGRDVSNEIVLDIPNVSRFHAVLTATATGVRLSDLSSTNGTYVNENPVSSPLRLASGDTIEIGAAKLRVELVSDLKAQSSIEVVRTLFDPVNTSGVVTVLVADICNYTTLSEALPPEDLTKTLQHWFERVATIIDDFGGKVDKYIGDCVMAFWRCNDLNTKLQTVDATKAALRIKEETQLLSKSKLWPHKHLHDWDCRLTLNTGQAMLGKIGGHGARDFTVLGDVVNVAFRLIDVASRRGYDFVIGEATARNVQDVVPVARLGPVPVKGRSQKVIAYTLPQDLHP